MTPRRLSRRPTIAIFGAGRLAQSVLPPLLQTEHRVRALYARRPAAARSVLRRLESSSPNIRGLADIRPTTSVRRALDDVSLVLIAVPDRAIAEMAHRLAEVGAWDGRVALHHAGSLGVEPLQALADVGASVGVLHPLQVLGDPEVAKRVLPGSAARIEGMPEAVATARALAARLKLTPLPIPTAPDADQRAAYHAAASLVSNDLVALVALALPLLQRAGVAEADGLRALLPLLKGTLAHLEAGGLPSALTGPAVRGDLKTLQGHLAQLGDSTDGAEAHRLLSLEMIRQARAAELPVPPGLERRVRRLHGED